MSRLDQEPDVLALATELGLRGDPVEAVVGYCLSRIGRWRHEAGGVATIADLESLVTQRLQMVFEEVRSDSDFDRLTETYARGKKDFVFATMRLKFDGANPIFGVLVQRNNVAPDAVDRFVAVIDCRGNKLARRFFTRWHEIAHRLTTHADMPEPVYRSEHDPIERLMDEIAGNIGFYGPLFDPLFRSVQQGNELLTLDTVKRVIDGGFPDASFQATLFACARRLPTPVVYLEAAIAHKKEVKRRIENRSLRLFDDEPPPGELRAVKIVANEAAQQERFVIPTNMRVPVGSVIHRLFDAEPMTDGEAPEDLGQWEDSKGKRLEGRAVFVEARKVPDRVIAIVQPTEPVRPKRQRAQGRSLFS